MQVGLALLEIRDQRLFDPEFTTFEAYCRERWGSSQRHANRLIAAAEIAVALGPIGPKNEAQARALAPLVDDPEALRTVAADVRQEHGENATAADYRQAVSNRREPTPSEPSPKMLEWRQRQEDERRLRQADRWAEEIIGLPGRLQWWQGEARDHIRHLDLPRRRALLRAVGKIAPAVGKLAHVLKELTTTEAGHKSDAARRKG
jgi:hypothetical protein